VLLISQHLSFVSHLKNPLFNLFEPFGEAFNNQAVAILAAVNNGVSTYEYTPARIKQQITNYGTSTKEQIQEMVRLELHLADAPEPADAADALAVAICHWQEIHLSNLISGKGKVS